MVVRIGELERHALYVTLGRRLRVALDGNLDVVELLSLGVGYGEGRRQRGECLEALDGELVGELDFGGVLLRACGCCVVPYHRSVELCSRNLRVDGNHVEFVYGCGVDVGVVAVLVLQTEGEGARRDDVTHQFGSRRYDGGRGLGQLVVVVVVRYRSGSLGSNQLELGNVLPYAVECYQLIVLLQHDGEALEEGAGGLVGELDVGGVLVVIGQSHILVTLKPGNRQQVVDCEGLSSLGGDELRGVLDALQGVLLGRSGVVDGDVEGDCERLGLLLKSCLEVVVVGRNDHHELTLGGVPVLHLVDGEGGTLGTGHHLLGHDAQRLGVELRLYGQRCGRYAELQLGLLLLGSTQREVGGLALLVGHLDGVRSGEYHLAVGIGRNVNQRLDAAFEVSHALLELLDFLQVALQLVVEHRLRYGQTLGSADECQDSLLVLLVLSLNLLQNGVGSTLGIDIVVIELVVGDVVVDLLTQPRVLLELLDGGVNQALNIDTLQLLEARDEVVERRLGGKLVAHRLFRRLHGVVHVALQRVLQVTQLLGNVAHALDLAFEVGESRREVVDSLDGALHAVNLALEVLDGDGLQLVEFLVYRIDVVVVVLTTDTG